MLRSILRHFCVVFEPKTIQPCLCSQMFGTDVKNDCFTKYYVCLVKAIYLIQIFVVYFTMNLYVSVWDINAIPQFMPFDIGMARSYVLLVSSSLRAQSKFTPSMASAHCFLAACFCTISSTPLLQLTLSLYNLHQVMLGSGDSRYESWMRAAEGACKDKFRGWVGFSVPISHRITAG